MTQIEGREGSLTFEVLPSLKTEEKTKNDIVIVSLVTDRVPFMNL